MISGGTLDWNAVSAWGKGATSQHLHKWVKRRRINQLTEYNGDLGIAGGTLGKLHAYKLI